MVSCAVISEQVDYSNLVIPHPAFAKRITQIITSHLQVLNRLLRIIQDKEYLTHEVVTISFNKVFEMFMELIVWILVAFQNLIVY